MTPYCGPTLSTGIIISTNQIYTFWGCIYTCFNFSGHKVFEKKNFNIWLIFSNSKSSSIKRGHGPSPKDTLCQVWSKFTQWFWRRSKKVYRWTNRQAIWMNRWMERWRPDKNWSEKLTWTFSAGKLKNVFYENIILTFRRHGCTFFPLLKHW